MNYFFKPRIITDGDRFAVARHRWICTEVVSELGNWYFISANKGNLYGCWTSLDEAERRLEAVNRKWKDYEKEE